MMGNNRAHLFLGLQHMRLLCGQHYEELHYSQFQSGVNTGFIKTLKRNLFLLCNFSNLI